LKVAAMTTNKKAMRPAKVNTADQTHYIAKHNPIDRLLPLLERVKRTSPNTWVASCPTRDDRHPSMTIRELDDGRVLIHDFGGNSPAEILAAIGLTFSDLYPERATDHHVKGQRRPFPAADCLRAVAFEATIIALAGAAIIAGEPFSQFDRDRLLIAVGRINAALDAGGLNHV
jgi:hypothetical protein